MVVEAIPTIADSDFLQSAEQDTETETEHKESYAYAQAAEILSARLFNRSGLTANSQQIEKMTANYEDSLSALENYMKGNELDLIERNMAEGLLAEVSFYTLFMGMEEYGIWATPSSAAEDQHGIDFIVSINNKPYRIDVTASDTTAAMKKFELGRTVGVVPVTRNSQLDERYLPAVERKREFTDYIDKIKELPTQVISQKSRCAIILDLADFNINLCEKHEKTPKWRAGTTKSRSFWEEVRKALLATDTPSQDITSILRDEQI